jgi:lysophospholipase L1-like esterase
MRIIGQFASVVLACVAWGLGCAQSDTDDGTRASAGTGGVAVGGTSTGGGVSTAGADGGSVATGGTSGPATGGAGGAATGGAATGGVATGGAATGGTGTGGTGVNPTCPGDAAHAYQGVIGTIPGTIQAEDFDPAGYSDSTAGNEGGAYRTNVDVDIKAFGTGYAVGWMNAGEWLEYTVNVATEGDYQVELRVGTVDAGRTLELSECGTSLTAPIAIPRIAAWGDISTATAGPIHLVAGLQVIRVTVGAADYLDFDSMTFQPYSGGTGGTGGGGTGGTGGTNTGGVSGSGGSTTGGTGGSVGYQPCPTDGSACKILPLGDSITWGVGDEGNGGYRGPLFASAVTAGQKITFTGSLSNGPTTVLGQPFPQKNEGHSGWGISQVTPYSGGNAGIATVIPSPAFNSGSGGIPNIILLHIGTNDQGSYTAAQMTSDLSGLLDKLITNAPGAYVVVAQIIPLGYGTNDVIRTYNQSIPGLVQQRANAGKHITIVDMFAGFATSSMLVSDNIHPNSSGYKFMADRWYSVIGPLLP